MWYLVNAAIRDISLTVNLSGIPEPGKLPVSIQKSSGLALHTLPISNPGKIQKVVL
jgi:hypothetical protein